MSIGDNHNRYSIGIDGSWSSGGGSGRHDLLGILRWDRGSKEAVSQVQVHGVMWVQLFSVASQDIVVWWALRRHFLIILDWRAGPKAKPFPCAWYWEVDAAITSEESVVVVVGIPRILH